MIRHALSLQGCRAVAALALCVTASTAAAAERAECNFPAAAKSLEVGASVRGEVGATECHAGNAYLYVDRAAINAIYRFRITRRTAVELKVTNARFTPQLNMFDERGQNIYHTRLGDRDDEFPNLDGARIRATLLPGTYYASVVPSNGKPGEFNLSLSNLNVPVGADDGGPCGDGALQRARKLELDGAPVDGELAVTDCIHGGSTYADIYYVDIPTRRTVEVSVTSPDYEAQAWLQDLSGRFLTPDGKNPQGANFKMTVPAGRYYLRSSSRKYSFVAGSYRASVRTVGTPGADSSTLGVACTSQPDPLTVGKYKAEVEVLLSPDSCKRKDGRRYHRYAFDLGAQSMLSMRGSEWFDLELAGPKGVIKPALETHGDHVHVNLEHVADPGRYVLTVLASPKAPADLRYLRFKDALSVVKVRPGMKGGGCGFISAQDAVEPGKSYTGELTIESCNLDRDIELGAVKYELTLIDPLRLHVELTPGKVDPGLAIAIRRQDGEKHVMLDGGKPFRKASVDLPPGTHALYVAGERIGSYTLKLGATPTARPPVARVLATDSRQCGPDDVRQPSSWPVIGEFNDRSCKINPESAAGIDVYRLRALHGPETFDIHLVAGQDQPDLVAGIWEEGEAQPAGLSLTMDKQGMRSTVVLPEGSHHLLIGSTKGGHYKLTVKKK